MFIHSIFKNNSRALNIENNILLTLPKNAIVGIDFNAFHR